ncbi:hypothetical protein [Syntrophothermus lipocalidus]|uniref:hypothetical protein n=1 Tax=Syntrophothermus lipocalidus TaxID=86170 RepID=UPI00030AF7EE|nr:hypothetical protein [Syntrophothermus lipocalidus]
MSWLLPRRLLLIFFGLAFLCSVAVAADLSGCRGAQKGAAALSPSLGYVTITKEGDKEVWTGRLRDSRGKEVMLFKFTPSGGEARQE